MLEKLKAEVLLAYQELSRRGLSQSTVSGIDREVGLIVFRSDRDALVVNLQGTVLEGARKPDVQPHIAVYQAIPGSGGVVQPYAAVSWGRTVLDAVYAALEETANTAPSNP